MICVLDKCIWIVCILLSLLIREYLSSAVNVLRRGVKNFHVCKSDFCNSITFTVITTGSRFLNTLTADDKYSLISKDNSMQTIQMHLSQKQNFFSQFFSAFSESALNFEHFQKKMTLIAYVFPNLPTTREVPR